MKNEKILHAIGQIDDDLIEAAVIQRKQPFYKKPAFRRGIALAACFALVVGLALTNPALFETNPGVPTVGPQQPPVEPEGTLPPLVLEKEDDIRINGLDSFSYYAAIRMVTGTPKARNQTMAGGSFGLSLLTTDSDTDKKDAPPEPETTAPPEETTAPPEETKGPPVNTDPPLPTDPWEDICYYAMDPNTPFYIDKVCIFQIELTDENGFLASKLGLGVVDVVITDRCIWDDSLITFRNGDRFYSCLTNGWSLNWETKDWQWEFSTHKYIEGFFVVKNFSQENYAFYIEADAEGQVFAVRCQDWSNGRNPDQNIKVVSTTVISNEGRSFTVAELEEYFNAIQLPESTTMPTTGI